MKTKLVFVLVALWFWGIPTYSQSQPLGAVVQTWHYDSHANEATVQIVNVSHKDITAYTITSKEIYADGHTDTHEHLSDFVGALNAPPEELKSIREMHDDVLHPGEIRDEIIGVAPGLKDFQVVVDVVAYADGTAETTNNDGLLRLVDHRKVDLTSRQLANQIIKDALANPNDPDPIATAAAKIQDRITFWKAQRHTTMDLEPGTLRGVVEDLKNISSQSGNKRDALSQYLAKSEEEITAMTPHSKLTKTEGPP